jgi:predicted transcriptional regulator
VDVLGTKLLTSSKAKERRSRIEIVYDIINLAQNGESEYKIREKVCLNGQQAKSYLNELAKLGLIETKVLDRRKIYVTSRAGNEFLKQYELLRKFL